MNPFERAAFTPGPLGHNDAASPDSPFWFRGDTPGPLGFNDHADPSVIAKAAKAVASAKKNPSKISGRWDPQAAVSYLTDPANGWAGTKSKGKCARAVRLAINAGHIATPNNPVPAKDYESYLLTLGFERVPLDSYSPFVGDVAVFPAIDGNPYGHIEMFTGDGWQSDFVQPGKPNDGKYGTGFFANQKWAKHPFSIFRGPK
jgi:hypothetical protein